MVKKQKKNSKKKEKKIKEIKKKKKIIEKESELEKDIEEIEETIEETGFKEFLEPIETSAPVLEKVKIPLQEPLELNIASTSTSSTKEKETGVDYITRNEPKYTNIIPDDEEKRKYKSEFRPPILRQTEAGDLRQEILTPQREAGMQESEDTNRIETNILEQKRREPFEREEKKYREVKF
jgi:hypothetical protein